MNDRVCPHPTCTRRIPRERFACQAHWWSLPASIRDQINAAWRAVTAPRPLHDPAIGRPPVRQARIDLRELARAQSLADDYWNTEPPPDPKAKLIRQERTGHVHIVNGAVIRSRGRRIAEARCGSIISGVPYEGRKSETTCTNCKEPTP